MASKMDTSIKTGSKLNAEKETEKELHRTLQFVIHGEISGNGDSNFVDVDSKLIDEILLESQAI